LVTQPERIGDLAQRPACCVKPPEGMLIAHLCQLGFVLQPKQLLSGLPGCPQQGLVENHQHFRLSR
jgi:hypothetical protein